MMELINYTKYFSIRDGKFTGSKRKPKLTAGKVLGAGLVGAGLGALFAMAENVSAKKLGLVGAGIGSILSILKYYIHKSEFYQANSNGSAYKLLDTLDQIIIGNQTSSSTTVKGEDVDVTTTTTSRRKRELEGVVYDIDKNINAYKVSISYEGNVMLIYLNKPTDKFIDFMDSELNAICSRYHNSDYNAYKIKDSYVVELKIVADSYWYIPYDLYEAGIKFNVLTNYNIKVK